jgi:branched-chain amino acid transport system substrate-binding protein
MLRDRFKLVRLVSCCVALALTANVGLAQTPPQPIEIPVILSLTGPAAFVGKNIQQALRILEASTNAAGGKPIHFDIVDDQTSPSVAVQLATGILDKGNTLFLGPILVGTCLAVQPLLKDRAVEYCLSPGIDPTEGGYTFSSGMSSRAILMASLHFLQLRGARKIGAILSTDATGQETDRLITQVLQVPVNRDLSLVADEHFAQTDLTVTAQFSHLSAAGAQACLCWTTGSGLETLMRGYADAGLHYPLVTSLGNMSSALMDQIAPFGTANLFFPAFTYFAPDAAKGALGKTIAGFRKSFDAAGVKPNAAAGLVWDSASIAVQALRQLGPSATARQIRDFIANLHDYAGIDGIYDFRAVPQRGLPAQYVTMVHWDIAQGTWTPAASR